MQQLTQVSESSRSTDPVQVGLGHLGEVEVDDDVDGLDVDASCEEVGRDQVAAEAWKFRPGLGKIQTKDEIKSAANVGLRHDHLSSAYSGRNGLYTPLYQSSRSPQTYKWWH